MTYANKKRKRQRRQEQDDEELMLQFTFFSLLMRFMQSYFCSSFGGNKKEELPRIRKDIEKDIFVFLDDTYFRRSYRMDKQSFYRLHTILKPDLDKQFFPRNGGSRDPEKNKYLINTKLRLSMAIRYFTGGSPLDIMLTHGVSFTSVFVSVWGIVDAVNASEKLKFKFPDFEEQRSISK